MPDDPPRPLPRYADRRLDAFVAQMEALGLKVMHHRDRLGCEGPAVVVGERPDAAIGTLAVIRASSLPLQHDLKGMGVLIHPRLLGKALPDPEEAP